MTLQTEKAYTPSSGIPSDTRQYAFYYDGKLPQSLGPQAAEPIAGQVGFLTAVEGPDFTRIMKNRPDGKLIELELRLPFWKKLVETYQYHADGTISAKTIQLHDLESSATLARVHLDFRLDNLGRSSGLWVNDKSIAALSYNSFSQLDQITLPDGELIQLNYDPITRKTKGITRLKQSTLASLNEWSFNTRGLIEQESFQFIDQKLNRSYLYSLNSSLTEDFDETGKRKYEYDSVGIPTLFADTNKSTKLETTLDQWLFQDSSNAAEASFKYSLDLSGRVNNTPQAKFQYAANGRVGRIDKTGKVIDYSYDETGKRIAKRVNGQLVEVYLGDLLITENTIYQPIKVSGIPVGVLENGKFIPLPMDFRGSVLNDSHGKMDVSSSYGERKGPRTEHSNIIDYVSQGFDPDLQAYRMEQRDYDPVAKRFLTPDPLFFENPEKCLESPKECNLYGYAKNNPVSFVDPTGKNAFILLDPKGAGEHGHSALVVGNKDAGYQFMSMGTMGGEFSQVMSGKTFEGIDMHRGPSFESVVQQAHSADPVSRYTQFIEIPTTVSQDKSMLNYVADRFAQDARTGINYSPLTNNCGDFVRDTLNAGGIQTERHMIPNDYFKGVDAKADLPHYSGSLNGGSK